MSVRWAAVLSAVLATAAAGAQVAPLRPGSDTPDAVLRRADWLGSEPLALEDLLRRVSGIAVARRGGLGSLEFLNVAGSTPGRLVLVLDGVELGEPELAWARLQAVPLSILDRIEVFRTRDPVRIALWTRGSESSAPHADFDLGRGSLVTRTRRVQLFTPARALSVALDYDELLRGGQDFRPSPGFEPAEPVGAYDDRAVLVRIGLERGGEALRVEFQRQNDNAHASFESASDVTRSEHARAGLRWDRSLGGGRAVFDLTHLAWDRQRSVRGERTTVREARTTAALDLELPPAGPWQTWMRLRAAGISGDRTGDAAGLRQDSARQDVELQVRRAAAVTWSGWAGAHHDERAAIAWSARTEAAWERAAWRLAVEAGSGVAFAGWGEPPGSVVRRGVDATLRAARRSPRLDLGWQLFAKRLDGRAATASPFFPGTGLGPRHVLGSLLESTERGTWKSWIVEARSGVAWIAAWDGDRAGLPPLQARLGGTLLRSMRGGDLVLALRTDWSLDARRNFAPGTAVPRSVHGDVTLEARVLRRGEFFLAVGNVADAAVSTFPGVLLPGRTTWFGVRARLLD